MNPYLLTENRVVKLVAQYKEHGSLIIGVDFDYTIYDIQTKEVYTDIVDLVLEAQKLNCKLCLWTANKERLPRVIELCEEHGLVFEYINESPITIEEGIKKPHFNLLLDDVAALGQAVEILQQTIKEITNEK